MKKKYIMPLAEVISLAIENVMTIDSQPPFADAREGAFDSEATTGDDEPIFDRWKNPTWEE